MSDDDRWDAPIVEAVGLYDRARQQWGDDAQLAKLAEETAELSAVASRALNGQADPDKFLEELVDARLMIEQFAYTYSPDLEDRLDRFGQELVTDGGVDGHLEMPDPLPPGVTRNETGAITMEPLTDTHPDPSLNRVVAKIEDYGTAPADGQRDHAKLYEAYLELGSWLRLNEGGV